MASLFADLDEVDMARRLVSGDQVRAVFEHWRTYHPRAFPAPNPTMKEWKRVKARLEEGYSVSDLKEAIDGIHKSPFHLGENERGKAYCTLELCCRDATHVEKFREIAAQAGQPILSEKTSRTLRAGQQWASRKGGDDGTEA